MRTTQSGRGAPGAAPITSTDLEVPWRGSSIVHRLLARKHSLLVMLSLYDRGSVSTSSMVRELGAHPATVVAVLRDLERLGILRRRREACGRHEVRASLTLKGMELVETRLYRWGRIIRDWDSAP